MQLAKLSHPTDDPELPSYVHPALAAMQSDLELVLDCWDYLKGRKEAYLPKMPREPKKAYEMRVFDSSYNTFYRDAIESFAGSLSRYTISEPPETFKAWVENIDGEGNSFQTFMAKADCKVLRDNGCLLVVDHPPPAEPGITRVDDTERRPKLAQIDRRNVLSWALGTDSGCRVLTRVVLLEWHEIPVGKYGTKFAPRYRVMDGSTWAVWEEAPSSAPGRVTFQVARDGSGQEMTGFFRDHTGALMGTPPVHWYSGTSEQVDSPDIPLLQLANLTLDHFREYSDLTQLLRKTALPTVVRKGVLGTGPNGTTPPVVLGPNSCNDIPAGAEMSFLEIVGSALDKHNQHLDRIENMIDRRTLSFLHSGAEKTAFQANLESVQVQATLSKVAEAKASVVQSMIQTWVRFTGEQASPDAGITMAKGVFDEPVTRETLRTALDLYDRKCLSRRSVITIAQQVSMLPDGQTVDEEIAAIEQEEKPPADVPPVNALAELPPESDDAEAGEAQGEGGALPADTAAGPTDAVGGT